MNDQEEIDALEALAYNQITYTKFFLLSQWFVFVTLHAVLAVALQYLH